MSRSPNTGRTRALLLLGLLTVVAVGASLFVWYRNRQPDRRVMPGDGELPSITKPPPAPGGYVGSESCRDCHAEVYAEYQAHPMAQSLFTVDEAPALEDYSTDTSFTTPAGRKYTIEKRDATVFHHEAVLDQAREAVYDQRVEVHYAMGSGRRGRSYMTNRDGWLYMSPVAWYTQAERWDLSPGYAPGSHMRFSRQALDRCVQCHAGRVNYRDDSDNYGVNYYQYAAAPFAELGLGCERCHGPGQAHIEHRKANKGNTGDPIINPEKLDGPRREAVCNQCHLQGEYQILRYGRKHRDFRPGENMGDTWSVFIKAEDTGPTEAVSHMEQMQVSRCFKESSGRLGCISCHDSHSIPDEATKAVVYRERCLECHQDRGCSLPEVEQQREPALGSCIACHMPRFSASDIPHTAQTDHRILREPEPQSDDFDNADEPPSLRIFDTFVVPLTKLEEDRAKGLLLANRAESYNNPQLALEAEKLLRPFAEVAADDVLTLDALAACSMLQGRTSEAIDYWERALGLAPRDLQAINSLMVVAAAAERYAEAEDYAQRYLAVNPWRASVHLELSRLLGRRGEVQLAIECAERAKTIDPTDFGIYAWLIRLQQRAGNADQVQELLATVRRLGGEIREIKPTDTGNSP